MTSKWSYHNRHFQPAETDRVSSVMTCQWSEQYRHCQPAETDRVNSVMTCQWSEQYRHCQGLTLLQRVSAVPPGSNGRMWFVHYYPISENTSNPPGGDEFGPWVIYWGTLLAGVIIQLRSEYHRCENSLMTGSSLNGILERDMFSMREQTAGLISSPPKPLHRQDTTTTTTTKIC